jgi:hypothetical protein
MRTSTCIGAFGVPISRDSLCDEMDVYDVDMLRPW